MIFNKGDKVMAIKDFTFGRFNIKAGTSGFVTSIGQYHSGIFVRWNANAKTVCTSDQLLKMVIPVFERDL